MPDDTESGVALRNAFQTAHGANRVFLANFALTFAAAVFGVTVQLRAEETRKGASIPGEGNRLLITFDQAHMAPAARLGPFLNAVQKFGGEMPFEVVLAGTPGLEDRLRESGASYWDRGLKLGVGRLSSAEVEEVIAEPFKVAGISVGDGIAAGLASEADCYPYFLQVYGGAAWDAVASGPSSLI